MRLPALQSNQGMISLLELDQALFLAEAMGIDLNLQGGQEQLEQILAEIITQLAPHTSAVAADSNYSFPKLMNDIEHGLVLRLTRLADDLSPNNLPQLAHNWGMEEIANNFAVAKLDLWYHPQEELALEKKKLAAELFSYAKHLQIDFMIKLNLFSLPQPAEEQLNLPETAATLPFTELQLLAIQELRSSCDIFALQYPGDPLGAATITAELDQPWIVSLENQPDYEETKKQLRISLENGAIGFTAGAVFWKELGQLRRADQSPDLEKIQQLIQTLARDRVIELVRIANEFRKS